MNNDNDDNNNNNYYYIDIIIILYIDNDNDNNNHQDNEGYQMYLTVAPKGLITFEDNLPTRTYHWYYFYP